MIYTNKTMSRQNIFEVDDRILSSVIESHIIDAQDEFYQQCDGTETFDEFLEKLKKHDLYYYLKMDTLVNTHRTMESSVDFQYKFIKSDDFKNTHDDE